MYYCRSTCTCSTRPPVDSGIAPVDPKNIFIMGDSAGGVKSLYFALLYESHQI
jgi:hypothetical protein